MTIFSGQEDDITIALRTRSKMPLDDTPLDIIEANFVAPDITADLYDTCCDNQDWLDFLNSLGKEGTLMILKNLRAYWKQGDMLLTAF